jgi:hypothetical protein
MSFIITGADSAGAVSLKRDSAAAAIKKALELIGDGCRDVCIRAQMAASTVMRTSTNSVPVRRRDASCHLRLTGSLAFSAPCSKIYVTCKNLR